MALRRGVSENLIRHLRRDGYTVDDLGRIRGGSAAALADIPLDQLKDASAIYEHLDRIAASTDTDPGVAISGAKALVDRAPRSGVGRRLRDRRRRPDCVRR